MSDLPKLHYIGDAVVGVVTNCECPRVIPPGDGPMSIADHPHESHDIVPPRMEDDMPEGVDFEHYKRWCRMFAAAPDLLAACEAVLDRHNYQGTGEPWSHLFDQVRAAVRKAYDQSPG
jgi:hypothetical protein